VELNDADTLALVIDSTTTTVDVGDNTVAASSDVCLDENKVFYAQTLQQVEMLFTKTTPHVIVPYI